MSDINNMAKTVKQIKKCKGKTSNGKPCSFNAKTKGLCGIHATKKKKGRKSKIDSIDYAQVEKLAKLGATDKDLAEFFDVNEATVNRWKEKDTQFRKSLKEGKEYADANVAERLYQRALGYEHPEDKIFIYEGEPVIVPTRKIYAPDTTAAIFWLKNRKPEAWRDKQEMDVNHTHQEWDPKKGDPKEYVKQQLGKE